jgi:hypothetical protein
MQLCCLLTVKCSPPIHLQHLLQSRAAPAQLLTSLLHVAHLPMHLLQWLTLAGDPAAS